mgnify:FL=1|tara:strand:+ start:4583 stop:4720 length:138 start_codon:yes stop_codon:yes gene_type:complete
MRRERDEKRKKFWCIFLKKANGRRESVVDDDFDAIKSMTTTKTTK